MSSVIERPVQAAVAADEATKYPRPNLWAGADRVILLGVMLLAFVLSSWNISGQPRYAEDEGVYAMQAWAIFDVGALSPYWYWYDHPPLGWMQMAPLMWIGDLIGFGDGHMGAARFAPVVALVASTGLLYGIARRLGMRKVYSVLTALVFLASPLVQEQLRKVYIDNISLPWVLLAFFLALGRPRHAWQFVQAGAAMAVAALSKETSVVMLPVLVAMTLAWSPLPRLKALGSVLLPFGMVAALYPLYALARGELLSMLSTLRWQLGDRTGSGALWDPDSLRSAVVGNWLSLDAVLVVGGLVGAVALLFVPRYRFVSLALVIPLLLVLRPSGYLPGMFINVSTPFLALALVGAASLVLQRLGYAVAGVIGLVLAVAMIPLGVARLGLDWFTGDSNAYQDQAVEWILENTPEDSTVLVDDTSWQALHRSGRDDVWEQTLLVYKLDTDPTALDKHPNGWSDLDYLVLTPTLRGSLDNPDLVQGRTALENSRVIATIGEGPDSVEIRQVVPLAGLEPPPASDCSAGYITLTFDDGPTAVTERLLDILRAKGVPAQFFAVGENATENPDILRRIVNEGHSLGNHTWTHARLGSLSAEEQEREIRETQALLEEYGPVPYFRSPYGETTPTSRALVEELGLIEQGWSLDPKDWENPAADPAIIADRVLTQAQAGDIVLLHDIYTLNTVGALPSIIDGLYERGFCMR